MKRFLLLFLALSISFCAIACNRNMQKSDPDRSSIKSETTTEPKDPVTPTNDVPFYAGYARADISPSFSVPLGDSMSKGVADKIYITVIAISDGENNALLITGDFKYSDGAVLARTRISAEKHGVPKENVILCATHDHSSIDYLGESYPVLKWKNMYYKVIDQAIEEALADLKPATAEIGEAKTTNFAFVRRYYMEDGSFKSIHHANPSNDYKEHESEADDQMQVIRFVRDGAKDIVVVNWQAHVAHAIGELGNYISADLVGIFRMTLERDPEILSAMFIGASGNINLSSYVDGKQIYKGYMSVGIALAQLTKTVLEDMKPVELGKIQTEETTYTATVDHSRDYLYDKASQVNNFIGTSAEKNEFARSLGFHSFYEPSYLAIKKNLGQTSEIHISVLSFGDIVFVAVPYEMFDTNAMAIKASSDFKSTFICASTNGRFGYIPSELGFSNGGYEVYTCRFVRGTGEELEAEYIKLLQMLADKK